MAWLQTTDGGIRRLASEGLFKPYPVTMTWSVYVDSLGAPSFGTMMAVGPTTFAGVNYYVCFHDLASVPQKWALGAEGTDALGSAPTTGRWYRQGFRAIQNGSGYSLSFWPDLPKTEEITRSESAFAIDFLSGHELWFGKVPWNAGEFIGGRMGAIKIWQAALPIEAIRREAASIWPVHDQFLPYLWAVLPGKNAGLAGRDFSGSKRHFTVGGTLSGTGGPLVTVR